MKNAVILTGASKGIGRAIAICLSKMHFNLVLVGRDYDELKKTHALCNSVDLKHLLISADLTEHDAINTVVDTTLKEYEGICGLVNNHGVHYRDYIEDLHNDTYKTEQMIKLNLNSPIVITKLILPHLIRCQLDQKYSKFMIFISSLAAYKPLCLSATYSATKVGLLNFSQALFDEVRNYGIKVSCICPGYVDTAQNERDSRLKLNPKNMIQDADIAEAVKFVIEFPGSACPIEIQIQTQYSTLLS